MLREVLEIADLLDAARVDGETVAGFFRDRGLKDVEIETLVAPSGRTDVVRMWLVGQNGRLKEGRAPSLGIIGQLGGVGCRPHGLGLVSDADGAVVALACALKLLLMQRRGDFLAGDVLVSTHVCGFAPVIPHEPVDFMGCPVPLAHLLPRLVSPEADAVLSVDTTRGNRVVNQDGFAITATAKEGWLLRVSDDLLRLAEWVSGRPPVVVPITLQDLVPYDSGVRHLNSIMQPATFTRSPVAGVALVSQAAVPGSATGVFQPLAAEGAARFCLEVAKALGRGKCRFYDPEEYRVLQERFGSLAHLQAWNPGQPS